MSVTDAPVLLGKYVPGSPEWWEVRRGRVGGSDVAAILGLSRWQSYFSLWHRHRGAIPPEVEKDGMEWGKRLEPAIIEKFRESHPDLVVEYPVNHVYAHPERPWQVASPDGLVFVVDNLMEPRSGVEVKTAHVGDAWEWGQEGTDEIPSGYRAQVDWYLDTFGLDHWHVAVLIGGSDYREYVITADETRAATARDAARAFLDTLEAGTLPDIDSHTATYQAIRQLHPEIEPEDVELSPDLARAFCMARHALTRAEGDVRLATSLVADFMGNAHRARFLDQTIADRRAKQGGVPYLQAGRNLPTFDSEAAT